MPLFLKEFLVNEEYGFNLHNTALNSCWVVVLVGSGGREVGGRRTPMLIMDTTILHVALALETVNTINIQT